MSNRVYRAWWKDAANPWAAEIDGKITYYRTRDEARKAAGLKPAQRARSLQEAIAETPHINPDVLDAEFPESCKK